MEGTPKIFVNLFFLQLQCKTHTPRLLALREIFPLGLRTWLNAGIKDVESNDPKYHNWRVQNAPSGCDTWKLVISYEQIILGSFLHYELQRLQTKRADREVMVHHHSKVYKWLELMGLVECLHRELSIGSGQDQGGKRKNTSKKPGKW